MTNSLKIVPLIESGRVFLPQQAVWLSDFEYEILMFPEARHDDQVDSTAQYLQWTRKTNTSAFRVKDFGPNPNKPFRWLRYI
ncbi:hypothetical protein wKueTS_09800 [Wolbachia pipientis]